MTIPNQTDSLNPRTPSRARKTPAALVVRPLWCLWCALLLSLGLGSPPAMAQAPYAVQSNGTVFNTTNGLVWDQCSLGLSGTTCTGTPTTYTFNDAQTEATARNTSSYKRYTDWRVPSTSELRSLVTGTTAPTIDITAFPGTLSSPYWTSTTDAVAPGSAELLSFSDGKTSISTKDQPAYVRLVRSGQTLTTSAASPTLSDVIVYESSISPRNSNLIVLVTSSANGTGYLLRVPVGSPVPTAHQVVDGVAYGNVVDIVGTSKSMIAGTSQQFIVGYSRNTVMEPNFEIYFVAVDDALNASAVVAPIATPSTYTITTTASPAAGGTVTCTPNPVIGGRTAFCTATAAAGYTFSDFSGDCTGATCTLSNVTASKSVTATFTPDKLSQTITAFIAPANLAVGGSSGTLSATGGASGQPVTFASITPAVCTVSGSTVTTVAVGTCTVTADQAGNATYNAAPQVSKSIPVTTTTVATRLSNLSTRGQVQTGDNVMIGGFVIGGASAKTVLIRAVGPNLTNFGVIGVLANPSLKVFSGSTMIASNDDWQTPASTGTAPTGSVAAITATGLAPVSSLESALLLTLNPGAYTAIVSGATGSAGGGTGVGIVEVFDIDHPEIPLVNISTRGQVLTGNDVMIGGVIVEGTSPKTVLIRAVGPNLANFGVTGVLANPTLQLFSGQTLIASNDDWGTAANATAIQATGFAPANALEAAILITLQPGAYTAIVSGANGGTGVGIVEVFAQ